MVKKWTIIFPAVLDKDIPSLEEDPEVQKINATYVPLKELILEDNKKEVDTLLDWLIHEVEGRVKKGESYIEMIREFFDKGGWGKRNRIERK